MSIKFPIISVTGSSGAGTTSVRHTFEYIFRRENVNAAFVQGDAFHRYDRAGMEKAMKAAEKKGNQNFSHFGEEANLLEDLEGLFRAYAATGSGRTRDYIHDGEEAKSRGRSGWIVHPVGRHRARVRFAALRRSARCGDY